MLRFGKSSVIRRAAALRRWWGEEQDEEALSPILFDVGMGTTLLAAAWVFAILLLALLGWGAGDLRFWGPVLALALAVAGVWARRRPHRARVSVGLGIALAGMWAISAGMSSGAEFIGAELGYLGGGLILVLVGVWAEDHRINDIAELPACLPRWLAPAFHRHASFRAGAMTRSSSPTWLVEAAQAWTPEGWARYARDWGAKDASAFREGWEAAAPPQA